MDRAVAAFKHGDEVVVHEALLSADFDAKVIAHDEHTRRYWVVFEYGSPLEAQSTWVSVDHVKQRRECRDCGSEFFIERPYTGKWGSCCRSCLADYL